jgi:hypothetical protein
LAVDPRARRSSYPRKRRTRRRPCSTCC